MTTPTTTLRQPYPITEPFNSGFLDVDEIHSLYYEQSGNPSGKPVIFVHGGPGGGTSPGMRSFFNPDAYRIILFDQRGAGKSTPSACVEKNSTWDLVADIEKLREHVGVTGQWVVFGGSWGSTLSLTYAITHPERVEALILRGVFLSRPKEFLWLYQEGASYLFPEEFARFQDYIPKEERDDIFAAYHRRLNGDDEEVTLTAAGAWNRWETSISRLYVDPATLEQVNSNPQKSIAIARIENHYFVNNCFFETDNWILENIEKIAHIPGVIVQGRYDVICPIISAYDLHVAAPNIQLKAVADAGHSMREPGMTSALIEAADFFGGVEPPAPEDQEEKKAARCCF